jgi:hypothetical protein
MSIIITAVLIILLSFLNLLLSFLPHYNDLLVAFISLEDLLKEFALIRLYLN